MAKKFAKLDYEIYKEEEKVKEKVNTAAMNTSGKAENAARTTPSTFISTLVSVVDNTIDVSHLLQGTILLFIVNLLYVKIQEEGEGFESLVTIGCTFATCIIELIAVIRNKYLNGKKIELPEWEYIYAISFPLLIGSLFAKDGGTAISCMVVQVGYMNVFVRILVSYVVAFQFEVSLKLPIITAISYETVSYFLPQVNVPERNAISIISTILLNNVSDNIEMIILRGLMISTIAAFIGSSMIYRLYDKQNDKSMRFATLFALYGVFICTFLLTSDKILYPVVHESPLLWVFKYIQRPVLKYWLALTASVPIIFTLLSRPQVHIAIRRKAWHLVLFAALAGPLSDEPGITAISLGAVLAVLILVESVRATRLPPFGCALQSSLALFADKKDSETTTMMSPAYLVLGVAAPLWLNLSLGHPERLSSYAGVLTVGLGDAAASVAGSLYGRHKLPGARNGKTLEGTAAMAVAVLAGTVYVGQRESSLSGRTLPLSLGNTTVFAVVAALFEGLLAGNDNLWVPALAYILAELLRHFQ